MSTRGAVRLSASIAVLLVAMSTSISSRERESPEVADIQRAIASDPADASSWLGLGDSLMASRERIPAILAYARFLTVHPYTPNSATIVGHLSNLVFQGVTFSLGS